MSLFASWRTALRIARREARRSKGRSSLVVAMIGLPVLCLAFAATSYDMFTLTGAERADQTMGAADARIRWPSRAAVEQNVEGNSWPAPGSDSHPAGEDEPRPATATELLAELPTGSTALPVQVGSVDLTTADGVGSPNAVVVDARDPITHGYVEVLRGRAPQTPHEVALTEQASERLGQGLGGTITSADGARTYAVVGEVEFASMLEEVVLFASVTDPAKGFSLYDQGWLVHTPGPVTWSDVRRLNGSGIAVASREVFVNPPPSHEIPNQYAPSLQPEDLAVGVIVVGLALLEIVLLAGPAFAVSARRRQRQLALVAANGGTSAHVRRIVLADGVVLGVVGALIGVVLGIGAAFLARPYAEEFLTHARAGGYRVFPLALLAIAVLAVVTGVLAALVPAFITARQNVISSLAGRRGATRSRKRWVVVGGGMVAVGSVIVVGASLAGSAWGMLAGLVVGELGLVLCTPALVGLIARFGRLLPLAPRIALRDAARNRAAAAPAISAVMAAVAGSVAIGLYLDSNIAQQEVQYRASLPSGYVSVYVSNADPNVAEPANRRAIENALRATAPVVGIQPVFGLGCLDASTPDRYCDLRIQLPADEVCPYLDVAQSGQRELTKDEMRMARADRRCDEQAMWTNDGATVDDGSALPLLTGASTQDLAAATAVLRAGGVVVADPSYVRDGRATFAVVDGKAGGSEDPALHAKRMSLPAYALTTGTRGTGPIVSPAAVAQVGFQVSEDPQWLVASTSRMPSQAEVDQLAKQLGSLGTGVYVEHGARLEIPIELWIIVAAAALITLGAAGIGTGLAAADGRADLSTLASVGASPRLRRGLSLSQAAVIAGLGSLLGAAAGLGAAVAVLVAMNQRLVDIWPAPTPTPIAVPWLSLAMALLVVPLVAILGAGLLTRSRLPIERRT